MNQEAVVLKGDLRLETLAFNNIAGQVIFRGSVHYRGVFYRDVPLVTLSIECSKGDVCVDDAYFSFLPYLKPVAAFRELLLEAMSMAFSGGPLANVLIKGMMEYAGELRSFSEVRSIVNQAKGAVNALDAKKPESVRLARAVLTALGKTPNTELPFEVSPAR